MPIFIPPFTCQWFNINSICLKIFDIRRKSEYSHKVQCTHCSPLLCCLYKYLKKQLRKFLLCIVVLLNERLLKCISVLANRICAFIAYWYEKESNKIEVPSKVVRQQKASPKNSFASFNITFCLHLQSSSHLYITVQNSFRGYSIAEEWDLGSRVHLWCTSKISLTDSLQFASLNNGRRWNVNSKRAFELMAPRHTLKKAI